MLMGSLELDVQTCCEATLIAAPRATSKYRVKQSNMTTSHSRQSNISWYKGAVFALPASKTHQYSKSFALWSDFCIYLWVFPYSVHGGLSAQGAEVCSYIACSSLCKLRQVHTGTNGHARTQNRQDVLSLLRRGSSNDDLKERGETQSLKDVYIYLFIFFLLRHHPYLSVKSSRPAQSWV